jgi:hypothetical protein
VTSAAAAEIFLPVTKGVIPAFNAQSQSGHQSPGDFAAGGVIYLLGSGAGYLHVTGALLLREALIVYEEDGLVFVHRQCYSLLRTAERAKLLLYRQVADFSAFSRSGHGKTPSLMAYVDNLNITALMAYVKNSLKLSIKVHNIFFLS